MLASGIYTIRNPLNGREYVGSAVAFRYRWNKHRSELNRGIHHSAKLQNAWNKYGADAFEFRVLLVCAKKDLLFYEQRALDTIRPFYNTAKVAGSVLGIKRPPITAAHRAKLIAAHTRREYSKRSPEQRAAMKEAQKKRPKDSYPKGTVFTPERCAKIAAALTGIVRSPETCARISAAKKGTVPTETARKNMSEAAKLAWERRKSQIKESA